VLLSSLSLPGLFASDFARSGHVVPSRAQAGGFLFFSLHRYEALQQLISR